MARHEKGRGSSLLMQDKFFYTLLTLTLVLMMAAFYFAFGTNQSEDVENQDDVGVADVNGPQSDELTETVTGNTETDPQGNSPDDTQVQAPSENVPRDEPANEDGNTPTEDSQAQTESVPSFIIPCDGTVIKDYSGTTPVFSETLQDWRTHHGIDFQTNDAANVFAAADGIVDDVYTDELMGVSILIKHTDGVYTLYQGLSENTKVLQRMEVKQGDVIGKTGTTAIEEETEGCHLHFEVIIDGKHADPNEYLS